MKTITKKLKGGKSYEVTWILGSRNIENFKIKTAELSEIAPDLFDEFEKCSTKPLKNTKMKPKPASKPAKVTDIRKFIQLKELNPQEDSSKRKIFSPNRNSNPMPSKVSKHRTPQKINSSGAGVEPANFSLGMSILCDQLENSTIEDVENSPPETTHKPTQISETITTLPETQANSRNVENKSDSPTHSPVLKSWRKPRKVSFSSSSESDEEFLSLSERVRLRKLTATS